MNQRALGAAVLTVLALGVAAFVYSSLSGSDAQDQVVTELEALAPDSSEVPTTPAPTVEAPSTAVPSPDAEDNFPALATDAVRDEPDRDLPVPLQFAIVDTLPHDTAAFTQGFEISDGRLFESTGLVGQSSIRELDLSSGEVIRQQAVSDVFAEGLTIVDDTALQLTWQDGVAYRYDANTFDLIETYSYEGEGWGLCHDGDQLVMSDGTPTLDFRDPESFELLSSIDVTLSGEPVAMLNELECVDGSVFANIWLSSLIIEIDPTTGNVIGVLNAATLLPPSVEDVNGAVLNGIAYDPSDGTFLLTGKLWPSIFRVQIEPVPQ